jgi:hypothetical protein
MNQKRNLTAHLEHLERSAALMRSIKSGTPASERELLNMLIGAVEFEKCARQMVADTMIMVKAIKSTDREPELPLFSKANVRQLWPRRIDPSKAV